MRALPFLGEREEERKRVERERGVGAQEGREVFSIESTASHGCRRRDNTFSGMDFDETYLFVKDRSDVVLRRARNPPLSF